MKPIKYAVKRLLYSPPGKEECSFRYFGGQVHFPAGAHVIMRAFQEGIFQEDLVQRICLLMKPGGCYLDIGANLGLMSLPILHFVPKCHVISFEPSPNALPYLERTWQDSVSYQDRWQVRGKALGTACGQADFFTAGGEDSAFDGLKNTGRAASASKVTVEVSTLDTEWATLGNPEVSVIKMDVEGGELAVLNGATACLAACRPVIFCEWNEGNLAAHGCAEGSLFQWAQESRYALCTLPALIPVQSAEHLRLLMRSGEEFVLLPLK